MTVPEIPPVPAIQRTEIDGVPTFWMDEPGPMVAVAAPGWKDGLRAIETIDADVPAGIVACDEHGIGALADPARDQTGTAGPG